MLPLSIKNKSTTTATSLLHRTFISHVHDQMAANSESKKFKSDLNSARVLTLDSMNANLKAMQYAVLGQLAVRSAEIEQELKAGTEKAFSDIIRTHIGDCQAMGQKPITFIRQVASLCLNPALIESTDAPIDAKDHARRILAACSGKSVGSYTESVGIALIRQDIAYFIQRRDGGITTQVENIVITEGATEGIIHMLKFVSQPRNGMPTGVMVPIPMYPLYSATLAEFGMQQIGYYLDEDNNWALDIADLRRAIREARHHCNPAVIVVINPGNPTGQVLTLDNIRHIIEFAAEEGLLVLADEVYQDNIYEEGSEFHSFKKVMTEMGPPYDTTELVSFYSASKGLVGECGVRVGYMEVMNLDSDVWTMLKKSLTVCHPGTIGQLTMDCIVNPPKPGMPSHDTYVAERKEILRALAEKAKFVTDAFNAIDGVHCNHVQGAMFAFPRLELPAKLILKAKELGVEPDFYYAQELLERTGICIVPGSGFGQRPGTYHFRTTILPAREIMEIMMVRFKDFHTKFMAAFQ